MIPKFVSGSLSTLSFTHAFPTSYWALPCGCLIPNLLQTLYLLHTLLLLNNHPCHLDRKFRITSSSSSFISHIQQLSDMLFQLHQNLPNGPLSSCPRTQPSTSHCRERLGSPGGRGSPQCPKCLHSMFYAAVSEDSKAKFWPLFCLKVCITFSPPSEYAPHITARELTSSGIRGAYLSHHILPPYIHPWSILSCHVTFCASSWRGHHELFHSHAWAPIPFLRVGHPSVLLSPWEFYSLHCATLMPFPSWSSPKYSSENLLFLPPHSRTYLYF